jgi:hypothetical protein
MNVCLKISDELYDLLIFLMKGLPAIGTFIVALDVIWGIPYANEIAKTLVAMCALLEGLITAAQNGYKAKED